MIPGPAEQMEPSDLYLFIMLLEGALRLYLCRFLCAQDYRSPAFYWQGDAGPEAIKAEQLVDTGARRTNGNECSVVEGAAGA